MPQNKQATKPQQKAEPKAEHKHEEPPKAEPKAKSESKNDKLVGSLRDAYVAARDSSADPQVVWALLAAEFD